VVDAPADRDARTDLLRGACLAGQALGSAGLGLGHAPLSRLSVAPTAFPTAR